MEYTFTIHKIQTNTNVYIQIFFLLILFHQHKKKIVVYIALKN